MWINKYMYTCLCTTDNHLSCSNAVKPIDDTIMAAKWVSLIVDFNKMCFVLLRRAVLAIVVS